MPIRNPIDLGLAISGVGAVDPPVRRAPTARELESIARSLLARTWKFSSTLD